MSRIFLLKQYTHRWKYVILISMFLKGQFSPFHHVYCICDCEHPRSHSFFSFYRSWDSRHRCLGGKVCIGKYKLLTDSIVNHDLIFIAKHWYYFISNKNGSLSKNKSSFYKGSHHLHFQCTAVEESSAKGPWVQRNIRKLVRFIHKPSNRINCI